MAHLTYGLNQGEGFIVITGDVGAGKTTLVEHLCSSLDPQRYTIAKIATTQTSADDMLRMIASDSMRHGDVVSQVISWLEADSKKKFELPGKELLESMLAMEDSAKEVALRESVKVDHPVARLLLEWIDMDEAKHGKMVTKMLALNKGRKGPSG